MLGQSGGFLGHCRRLLCSIVLCIFFVARRPGKSAQHMGLASFSGAS